MILEVVLVMLGVVLNDFWSSFFILEVVLVMLGFVLQDSGGRCSDFTSRFDDCGGRLGDSR